MNRESRMFSLTRTLTIGLLALTMLAFSATAQQGQINTVVGGGPNNIPAVDSNVSGPNQVALDSSGNYYLADYSQNQVFKVNRSTGILTVVAGNGIPGYSGDGVPGGAAQAMVNGPTGVTVDNNDNVYIADKFNCVIRKVDTTDTITTVVGTQGSCQYDGDGSPATSYSINQPQQLAVDSSGNVFIADFSNSRIRKLTVSTGAISTVAGNGGSAAYCANGTAPTSCSLGNTPSVAVDSVENIYFTDFNECVLYKINHITLEVVTLAGVGGTCGYSGDGNAATSAEISPEFGQLAVSSTGQQVWLADGNNQRIRLVIPGGNINTVAGNGSQGYSGDGGKAIAASLDNALGIAADNVADLFIGDFDNDRVREVPCSLGSLSGTCTPPSGDTDDDIYTVAGNGNAYQTSLVNGLSATGVTLSFPDGVLADPSDNIFLSDEDNDYVREALNSNDDINLFAGDGMFVYSGDNGPATSAGLNNPAGLSRDAAGNIFIADAGNSIIRKVNTSGIITTVAGTPITFGYSGDGGPATSAQLSFPSDVFVDNYGNMFIADSGNDVIREVVCATTGALSCTPPAGKTTGYIYTVAGNSNYGGTYTGDGGPATSAGLNLPSSVAVDGAGNLYIADEDNCRIREVNAVSAIINTIAGDGECWFTGDGPAVENSLDFPEAVRVDANGNVFIADSGNSLIRWVDGSDTLTTFAGTPDGNGFSGDGGLATSAELSFPLALSEDASGNFLVADSDNNRIRKINAFAAVGRSAGSVNFSTQSVGTTSDPFDVTLSGIGPASITNISASGDFKEVDDCVGSLPNGTQCTASVSFAPTKSGTRTGTLTVTTNGYLGTTTTVALQGEATGLTVSGTLAFGSNPIGTAETKSVTVKGSTTYASVALTEDTTDFTINSNTCTGTVTTSCVIEVDFNPQTPGAKKATLVIKDSDPTSPQLVAATGTGTSNESFTPSSVTFANEVISTTSSNEKITFKYAGTGTLALTSLTPSPSANFSVNETGITTDACDPGTTTLTKNEFCYFNVTFSPGTTLGTITGTVTASFTGDPAHSSMQLPLTGAGTEVKITGSLGFGTVVNPNTSIKSVTVTNEGTTTLSFSASPAITGTGASYYTVLPYSSMGPHSTCLNGTVTLTHLQTCTISVQFTPPTGSGTSYPADLNISDNGGGNPQLIVISGKN
jgi:trimeric autotransporter adhesin